MYRKTYTTDVEFDHILDTYNDIVMNCDMDARRLTSFGASRSTMQKIIMDTLSSSLAYAGKYDPYNIRHNNIISLCKQIWMTYFDHLDPMCDGEKVFLSNEYDIDVTPTSRRQALETVLKTTLNHGDDVVFITTEGSDGSEFKNMYMELSEYSTAYYRLEDGNIDDVVNDILMHHRPKVIIYAAEIMGNYDLIEDFEDAFNAAFLEQECLRGRTQEERESLVPKRIMDISHMIIPVLSDQDDFLTPVRVHGGLDAVIFGTHIGLSGPQGAIVLYRHKTININERFKYRDIEVPINVIAAKGYLGITCLWQSFSKYTELAIKSANKMAELFSSNGLDVYLDLQRPDFIVDISSLLDLADMSDVLSYLLYKYNYDFETCLVPGQCEGAEPHGLHIHLFDIAQSSSADIINHVELWVNNIVSGIRNLEKEYAEKAVKDELEERNEEIDENDDSNKEPKLRLGDFFRKLFKGGN